MSATTSSSSDVAPPKRVLLLIDVQVAMVADPPLGVPAARIVRDNTARILAHARASSQPPLIVHVRNCGDAGEPDEQGAPGWQLVHAPRADEPVLDKRKNNAFVGNRLAELVPHDAALLVAGLQSDFCIRATCSAALARGNDVFLVRGAHATYDRVEVLNGGTITPAAVVAQEIEAELEEAGVIVLEMEDIPSFFSAR